MAVVVSASQNEIADMAAKGVDIVPHRKRMVDEDLDTQFKDPDDPLRIVFVCAMWLTGFDAPATSTIYLDKPMRNHTLMQTIARANRVFQGKQAGEIIDYIGVFRNLQEALAIYGSGSGGGVEPGDLPVEAKEVQAEELAELLDGIEYYAARHGVTLSEGIGVAGFDWVAWLIGAADKSDSARRRAPRVPRPSRHVRHPVEGGQAAPGRDRGAAAHVGDRAARAEDPDGDRQARHLRRAWPTSSNCCRSRSARCRS